MTSWWRALSGRERSLIAAAIAVAAVLGAVQFLLLPLQGSRADARRDYAEALDLLEEVRAGVARAPTPGTSSGAGDIASLRSDLMVGARQRGLAIAQVQPLAEGALSMRLDAADPVLLYEWLAEAASDQGVRVRRASLTRSGAGGVVQATVVVEGSGA